MRNTKTELVLIVVKKRTWLPFKSISVYIAALLHCNKLSVPTLTICWGPQVVGVPAWEHWCGVHPGAYACTLPLYWSISKTFQVTPNNASGGSKGGREGRMPPSGPKFLHFHAVYRKNWSNNRLAPPSGVGGPLWEILDPSLDAFAICFCNVSETRSICDRVYFFFTKLGKPREINWSDKLGQTVFVLHGFCGTSRSWYSRHVLITLI